MFKKTYEIEESAGFITIPLKFLTSLNPYINTERRNKIAAATLKRNATYAVQLLALKAMKQGILWDYPADLMFDWYLKDARTDPDNWSFSRKFIFDGFQKARIKSTVFLPNDSIKYLNRFIDSFYIDKSNPRVEIRKIKIRRIK